jgi:hypothetical protein
VHFVNSPALPADKSGNGSVQSVSLVRQGQGPSGLMTLAVVFVGMEAGRGLGCCGNDDGP